MLVHQSSNSCLRIQILCKTKHPNNQRHKMAKGRRGCLYFIAQTDATSTSRGKTHHHTYAAPPKATGMRAHPRNKQYSALAFSQLCKRVLRVCEFSLGP